MKSIHPVLLASTLLLILQVGCSEKAAPGSPSKPPQRQMGSDGASICAKQARDWFGEHEGFGRFDESTSILRYSSHFNQPSNQCFIFIEDYRRPDSGLGTLSLWDVRKNIQYGSFQYEALDGSADTSRQIMTCWVQTKRCSGISEFKSLIAPYTSN
jgi:hypothetical protein